MPKIEIPKTVIKFNGIIIFNGATIKLKPYNKKPLTIIFFRNLKHFFNIISPTPILCKKRDNTIIFYFSVSDIFFRSSNAISNVNESI